MTTPTGQGHQQENEDQQPKPKNVPGDTEVVDILYGGSAELSSLIKGFKPYLSYMWGFMRRPFSFVQYIDYGDQFLLRNAFIFLCYSILLYYIFLLPVFVYHGEGIHRVTFYLRTIIQGGIAILGLHLGLRIIGGRGTWKQTFSATLFSSGFLAPFSALFLLPAYFMLGPGIIFGESATFIEIANSNEPEILFGLLYFNLISGTYGLTWFIHYLKYSKVIHGVSWLKAVGAYLLGMAAALPLLMLIINPFLNATFKYVEQAIDYIL
jgi:hypothetical protein